MSFPWRLVFVFIAVVVSACIAASYLRLDGSLIGAHAGLFLADGPSYVETESAVTVSAPTQTAFDTVHGESSAPASPVAQEPWREPIFSADELKGIQKAQTQALAEVRVAAASAHAEEERRAAERRSQMFRAEKAALHPGPCNNSVLPCSVYMFWKQGWDQAKDISRMAAQSWEIANPGWVVHLISQEDLPRLLSKPVVDVILKQRSARMMSNLVRVNLLAAHGGIWADCDVFCGRPVKDWLFGKMVSGFYAYRLEGLPPRPIASWFMASVRGGYIISRYAEAANNWAREHDHPASEGSFTIHQLFLAVLDMDEQARRMWYYVPTDIAMHGGQNGDECAIALRHVKKTTDGADILESCLMLHGRDSCTTVREIIDSRCGQVYKTNQHEGFGRPIHDYLLKSLADSH